MSVNQSKHVISPIGARKRGIYLWGDSEATWGDAEATWGEVTVALTNPSKHAISPTNQPKS